MGSPAGYLHNNYSECVAYWTVNRGTAGLGRLSEIMGKSWSAGTALGSLLNRMQKFFNLGFPRRESAQQETEVQCTMYYVNLQFYSMFAIYSMY